PVLGSSSSDSEGHSGTSTPSSEFQPAKLFLLPPSLATPAFLTSFASKLEKGLGDKAVLSVQNKSEDVSTVDEKDSLLAAFSDLALVFSDFVNKQWSKVTTEGQDVPYFVDFIPTSVAERSTTDEFIAAHAFKSPKYTPASALHLFSTCGLRSVYSRQTNCGRYTLH
ncbi:hypothetical protein BJ138DRAFT_971121, partial [Hygrophoropsis aurantiaca]